MRFPNMGSQVHARSVEPAEKWRVRLDLTLHEIDRCDGGLVVDGLHSLPGEGAGVFYRLLADLAPAGLLGWVVAVGRFAAQHTARTKGLPKLRIPRIGP